MPTIVLSPNMNLPIPVVGIDPGPDWATNINASLTLLDSHNHTSGYGVQITPSAININSNLTFQSNNAIALRSARFSAQGAPLAASSSSDVGCIYVSAVDLYFNDISGNQIRLTQSGGVAGSPGSITNLVAPASATYVSGNSTFVWQSGTNTAANMDGGSVLLRNLTINSKALTLAPPAGMAANYTITLPALPGSQSFMTIDGSGNVAAPALYPLTNSSIAPGTITSSSIGALTIIGANIAPNTLSDSKLVYKTITGSSIATATIQKQSMVPLGQATIEITQFVPHATVVGSQVLNTTGRPIFCMIYGSTLGYMTAASDYGLAIRENGSNIGGASFLANNHDVVVFGFGTALAGSNTYDITVNLNSGSGFLTMSSMIFTVYEL